LRIIIATGEMIATRKKEAQLGTGLTMHARGRVAEYTKLTVAQICELVDEKSVPIGIDNRNGREIVHRLFYSKQEEKYFVALQDRGAGSIITVLRGMYYGEDQRWPISPEAMREARHLACPELKQKEEEMKREQEDARKQQSGHVFKSDASGRFYFYARVVLDGGEEETEIFLCKQRRSLWADPNVVEPLPEQVMTNVTASLKQKTIFQDTLLEILVREDSAEQVPLRDLKCEFGDLFHRLG